jgi:biopolymer transport protein ExbD
MAFQFKKKTAEEPEINLIPFIDVLLVIMIFLMLSTTFTKLTELQVNLPVANGEKPLTPPRLVSVAVATDGRYAVGGKTLSGQSVEELASEITLAAGGSSDAQIVISADATAAHQSVINVLDAARRANLPRITFATQNQSGLKP